MFTWYKIFNRIEFEALGLVSRNYIFELGELGEKEILVTKGNGVCITYEGVMLMLNLNDKNPFVFDGHAIKEAENNDVYLGIEVEDEA